MAVKVPSVIEQPATSSTCRSIDTGFGGYVVRHRHRQTHVQRPHQLRPRQRQSHHFDQRRQARQRQHHRHHRQGKGGRSRASATRFRSCTLFYTQDQAPFAQSQVTELQGNIVTALVLVMVLVVAAMGIRSGLIVGAGIPVSFLFALIFIYQFGLHVQLHGHVRHAPGLGMLIDGAIVVTEYADRKMVEGFDPKTAYALAPSACSGRSPHPSPPPWPRFCPSCSGRAFGQVHALSARDRVHGAVRLAALRPRFRPALGAIFGKAELQGRKSLETLQAARRR